MKHEKITYTDSTSVCQIIAAKGDGFGIQNTEGGLMVNGITYPKGTVFEVRDGMVEPAGSPVFGIMVFHLTRHALSRMEERRVPCPDRSMNLTPAGRKTRQKIRIACPRNGTRKGLVYWTYNTRYVYVCEVLAAGEYRVVTAFDLLGQ